MFCCILCCFIAKFLFYTIYAVLSRNLFCRDLRALAWRKIEPKIFSVEKKGQISGMVSDSVWIISKGVWGSIDVIKIENSSIRVVIFNYCFFR